AGLRDEHRGSGGERRLRPCRPPLTTSACRGRAAVGWTSSAESGVGPAEHVRDERGAWCEERQVVAVSVGDVAQGLAGVAEAPDVPGLQLRTYKRIGEALGNQQGRLDPAGGGVLREAPAEGGAERVEPVDPLPRER